MIHYTASDLSIKQNYKFLTASIIPRPIAWLTTMNKERNVINAAPYSFFNAVSKNPPLVSVSIERIDGKSKDSAKNLLANGETVIHLVNDTVVEAMSQTSASLPPEVSELSLIKHSLTPSKSIAVPAIAEAPIRMEARCYQYIPVKNHEGGTTTDFFILEILDYYFAEALFDETAEYVLPEVFNPILRLAGNYYGHLADIIEIKRPE